MLFREQCKKGGREWYSSLAGMSSSCDEDEGPVLGVTGRLLEKLAEMNKGVVAGMVRPSHMISPLCTEMNTGINSRKYAGLSGKICLREVPRVIGLS